MRIFLNILSLLLLPGFFLGQGGFKKRHFLPNTSYAVCRDVIEAPDGNLIAMGISLDSSTYQAHFMMLGMNAAGDTLWTKKYGGPDLRFFDNDLHFRAPMIYDSSGIYLALSAWNGVNPRAFGVLMKCDYNGDTIWQKKLLSTDTLEDVIPQGICKSVDGGLLITGLFQWWGATATRKAMVLKTDINGEELWRKKITKNVPEVQDGKAIVQDKATKKIVVAGYQYIGTSSNWNCFGSILILDSLGNKILQTTFTSLDAGIFGDLIQTSDGNFVVCGSQSANNPLGNMDRYRGLLVKFTINGSQIWRREYDRISPFNSSNNIIALPGGDIMMTGYLDTLINYNIYERMTVNIFRLDQDGLVKWRRDIGTRIDDEQPVSINPTKDGGFLIAVREILAPLPNPFNFIKIDSNGCDTTEAYCKYIDALGLGEDLNALFSFFPNPASDKLFINPGSLPPGETKITFSNVAGREIKTLFIETSDKELDISDLPGGIYFVSLYAEEKRIGVRKLAVLK